MRHKFIRKQTLLFSVLKKVELYTKKPIEFY